MRYRIIAALVAVFALGAVTATGAQAAGQTLTVWLQVDAQNGWPGVVAAASSAFEASHPGWTVNVDYQQWSDHLQKFDATVAGNDTPDVIEMGNTEMTKYMAAGEFANLGQYKSQFANSSNWLAGLQASATYNKKLYGVPYYAGSRVITYRSDLFRKAGIRRAPKQSGEDGGRSRQGREDGKAASRASPRSTSAARTGTPRSASSSTTADRSPPSTTACGRARSIRRTRSRV